MADPWNAAWAEAEASVPADIIVYPTIELRHPAFIEGGLQVAIRAVSGPADDMSFTIEDGALMNGGELVVFRAIPFYAERPEFGESKMPETQITIDNVNREMIPLIEKAVMVRADLVVAYREYRSDDLSEPCFGPVEFTMRKVTMSGAALKGVAKLDNMANTKFPSKVYSIYEYPSLLS